jgi:hypothetical protein
MLMMAWNAAMIVDLIPNRTIVMATSGILQSVIPLALYGMLWRRMSKAGTPGRSRALFLAVGIVFLIFGSAGGGADTPLTAVFVLCAFIIWWLGITGRADQLLKTGTTGRADQLPKTDTTGRADEPLTTVD